MNGMSEDAWHGLGRLNMDEMCGDGWGRMRIDGIGGDGGGQMVYVIIDEMNWDGRAIMSMSGMSGRRMGIDEMNGDR